MAGNSSTSVAFKKYAGPVDIAGDEKSALIDLLYRLADDDLVIGHRNTEWTGLGPILEADIAFSSIAQDQIGQALAYYRILHDLGEPDPDTLAFSRGPQDYRCASLCYLEKGDWATSTVRLFFYDTYKSLCVRELCDSAYEPLAHLARKVRGEQKYHLMHAQMWISRLGDATTESHGYMQSAVDKLYPYALGLFEPTPWSPLIASIGFGRDEGELCESWRREAAAALAASGLTTPMNVEPVYGGRRGRHEPALASLLDAMQQVYRLDPGATW